MSPRPLDSNVVVLAERTRDGLPVTHLVARPAVRIIDGRLVTVLELLPVAA